MTIHIVQIEKHKFVCGLFWQSLSRPRELWKEARALAAKVDSDLLVIRRDQMVAQAGYARSSDGARRGHYSLAAILSKTIALEGAEYDGRRQPVHNWLGAFKLPDGMWMYCAVRDANFLPNGDFAGTREAVLDKLLSDYGLGGWNVVIGDPELEAHGFHNFCAKSVEQLIPHTKRGRIRTHRWWGLVPVQSRMSWKKIAAAAVAVALLATIGLVYWKRYQHKKEEEEYQRAMETIRLQKLMQQATAVVPPVWPAQPLPSELARACMDKFTLIAPGGWQLTDFQCTVDTVSYVWSRGDSGVRHLLRDVPQATISLTGEKATYSEALTVKTGQNEELIPANTLLSALLSRFQALDIVLGLAPVSLAPAGSNGALPTWQTYSLSARLGALMPLSVADRLEQPGVRLEQLSYRNGEWSIKGVAYAK